jgi:ferredoxin
VCACSTCHVYVEEGAELLTPASEDEEDILDKAFDVQMSSRLGCQAIIQKDGVVAVRISKESLEAYYNEHPAETRPGK